MLDPSAAGHDALTIRQGFRKGWEASCTAQYLSSMHCHALCIRISWITTWSDQPQILDSEICAETSHAPNVERTGRLHQHHGKAHEGISSGCAGS